MKRIHQQDVSITAPSRRLWRRTLGLLVAVVLLYAAVGGKLIQLQLVQHEQWQTLAAEQQLGDTGVADKRGTITDRNGTVLAQSVSAATVILSPSDVDGETARAAISDGLSAILGIDRDTLYKKTGRTSSRCEIVARCVDKAKADATVEFIREGGYGDALRVIGDYKREYPLNTTLSHVLGFVGVDNTGLEGLEAKYNGTLAGKAGRIITTKNGWGDPLPNALQYETAEDALQGNGLILTVDVNIQRLTEKHLAAAMAQTAAASRACAIVMEVETGAILAMATAEGYDLNNPRVLVDPADEALLAQLAEDERSAARITALQQQWKNKAVSEFYEPGSVFKIFTASMALEEKLVSEQSHFFCNGTFQMSGVRTMKCHVYPRSHGDQTLAQAISHSCNPAFMTIGSRVGVTLFPQYHAAFGFTELSGIDMLGEARVTPTLYHAAGNITAVDVATSSIGQTFKVTPIQLITGVCAVANGGTLMTPYVVSAITDPDGTVIERVDPTARRRVISEATSQAMCRMLEGVVDGGGAKNAYVAGYRVAGKTGTSEKTDQKTASANGRKGVVASFCGFAPADDPRIAVMVMIDEPQTAIRYGGTLAAPVAQKIFADALPYLEVQPQYKPTELEALSKTVPAVTDRSVTAATAALKAQGLTCRIAGSGQTVTAQSPAAGQPIAAGGCVVLYTDGQPPEQTAVPAVTGLTLTEANRLLTEAGLNVKLIGWTDRDGHSTAVREATVGAQSAAAGEIVPAATVIELTVRYSDSIE